jgi:hypothetical protein
MGGGCDRQRDDEGSEHVKTIARALNGLDRRLQEEGSVRRGAQESLRKAIAEREALDGRLQAAARVASTLRTLVRDWDESVLRCLDDLDKAIRGMPLGETRGRQGERFHAPVTRAEVAPDRPAGSLQDRLAEVERRLTIGEAMHTAHEDHFGLLDQRVAALGNARDEVRPAAPTSAAERPRAAWTWADEGTAGSDKGPAKKRGLLNERQGPSLRPWWEYDSASPPAVDLGEIDLSVVPANDGEVR